MDDVARRREARRRKILENSQNRLNRITGIEEKSTKSSPVCENDIRCNSEYPPNSTSIANESIINEVHPQQDKIKQPKQRPKQYRTTVISALAIFINVLLVIMQKFTFNSNSAHVNKDVMIYFFVFVCCEFVKHVVWTLS